MVGESETQFWANEEEVDAAGSRLAANPELWFALSGLTLLVVGLVGVVDLNDESDLMQREIGWYGIGGVALLGAVALVVSLIARSRWWLWVSGLACLVAVGGMTLPLKDAFDNDYSDTYWDFVTFDHNLNSEPGWWQWFVGRTLVVECLVGIVVTSTCLIVGTIVLLWRRSNSRQPEAIEAP